MVGNSPNCQVIGFLVEKTKKNRRVKLKGDYTCRFFIVISSPGFRLWVATISLPTIRQVGDCDSRMLVAMPVLSLSKLKTGESLIIFLRVNSPTIFLVVDHLIIGKRLI